MATYGQRSINGSVEWLGIPAPFCDTGVAWTDDLLVPKDCWGDRYTVETWDLGTKSGVCYGEVDVPWRGAIFSVRRTFLGVWKTRVQLRAASVTFTFRITI